MRVCLGALGVEQYNGVKRWRSYGEGARGVESFFFSLAQDPMGSFLGSNE